MTHLRQQMLAELQRRNYSPATIQIYLLAVRLLAAYFRSSPDQLGPEQIRDLQLHLFQDRNWLPIRSSREQRTCASSLAGLCTNRRCWNRFLFRKHRESCLACVLSPEQVTRLLDSAATLRDRTMLMILYSTGIRRTELCHLQVAESTANAW